ncbi:MAG: transcriptional regulator NrdR [Candidatus Marinimicrobia bacterium]|nr:transcriptional regulator NrdR [Candidatus Neomarinimicrobiota bacterium]
MNCPNCNHSENKVIDSRHIDSDNGIRRRRECLKCHNRFTTYEYVTLNNVFVIKSDGSREEFNRKKIIQSIKLPCTKRPISMNAIIRIAKDIEKKIEKDGYSEVKSELIGAEVIKRLRKIDKVAYIRFASIYHDFKDVSEFKNEIENMEKN